jgi:hypothetical protein
VSRRFCGWSTKVYPSLAISSVISFIRGLHPDMLRGNITSVVSTSLHQSCVGCAICCGAAEQYLVILRRIFEFVLYFCVEFCVFCFIFVLVMTVLILLVGCP